VQANLDKRQGIRIEMHDKVIYRDMNALCCLSHKNPIRRALIYFVEWKWFDRMIMFAIIINSVLLGIRDYENRISGPEYCSSINPYLDFAGYVLTILFMVECVLKIITMGFIIHKTSYLHDYWNWLDFAIVCVSIVDFMPSI